MATKLPGALPRRPTTSALTFTPPPSPTSTATTVVHHHRTPFTHTPSRNATIVRRPRRPYAFTQLVQLSDGSTYTQRTASPLALYRSVKDTRNHALWQPSDASLRNVEVDEAGKLAAFRHRFCRAWDADAGAAADSSSSSSSSSPPSEDGAAAAAAAEKADASADQTNTSPETSQRSEDSLSDLISGYVRPEDRDKASPGPPRKK